MRQVTRILKRSIVAVGLLALSVVLFPGQTEPLYEWANTLGSAAVGQDALPSFGTTQGFASLGLLVMVLGGVAYNAWRDRRFEVLQAEYELGTGAKHLRDKLADMEKQVEKLAGERDEWKEAYGTLNREHTAVLVAAKEHEVRSRYGLEDRAALRELRAQFDDLLKEKGHIEGFREAMEVMMARITQRTDAPANTPPQTTTATTKPHSNGFPSRALPGERC